MKNSNLKIAILLILSFVVSSFISKTPKLKGNWKISSVLVDSDTLYEAGNRNKTSEFYPKKMNSWRKSESDAKYIEKCIRSTFYTFEHAQLSLNNKHYTLTKIQPCWDDIFIKGSKKGSFQFENETLQLLDSKIELKLHEKNLIYSKNQIMITFEKH